MSTRLSSLSVGLIVAFGIALGAIACSESGALPVSPSAVSTSGPDASAVKGTRNFCAYVRAHETDPVYVVGQDVWLSLYRPDSGDTAPEDVSEAQKLTSRDPHGEVCFSVPTGTEYVYLYIPYKLNEQPPAESYCFLDWVKYAFHGGPSYIWLMPDDGTHDCSYPNEPY